MAYATRYVPGAQGSRWNNGQLERAPIDFAALRNRWARPGLGNPMGVPQNAGGVSLAAMGSAAAQNALGTSGAPPTPGGGDLSQDASQTDQPGHQPSPYVGDMSMGDLGAAYGNNARWGNRDPSLIERLALGVTGNIAQEGLGGIQRYINSNVIGPEIDRRMGVAPGMAYGAEPSEGTIFTPGSQPTGPVGPASSGITWSTPRPGEPSNQFSPDWAPPGGWGPIAPGASTPQSGLPETQPPFQPPQMISDQSSTIDYPWVSAPDWGMGENGPNVTVEPLAPPPGYGQSGDPWVSAPAWGQGPNDPGVTVSPLDPWSELDRGMSIGSGLPPDYMGMNSGEVFNDPYFSDPGGYDFGGFEPPPDFNDYGGNPYEQE